MTSVDLQKQLDDFLSAWPETRFMEPLIADMNGILRGKRVGVDDLGKAFKNGVNMCAATTLLDTMGNTFSGIRQGSRDGDPDVKAMAVPGTLAPVPWATLPTAQVLLEMINPDGSPLANDPRNVLRRALQPLAELGLKPVIALELEFYLVEHDGVRFHPRMPRIPGSDLPQPGTQYSVMEDLYEIDDFMTDLDAF